MTSATSQPAGAPHGDDAGAAPRIRLARLARPTRRARLRQAARLAAAVILLAAGTLGPAAMATAASGTGGSSGSDDGSGSVNGGVQIGVTVPETGPGGGDGGTGGAGTIANAQLRWGLNHESGSGAFFGGCNFLSAGATGDAGSAHVWAEGEGLYSAQSGAVRIERASGDGWAAASFATKCLDAAGKAVTASSTNSYTANQVVIDGGTGALTASGLKLSWSGAFTVAFYGGMTYWTVTDPQLVLDANGDGALTGTAGGWGTSMEDQTKWVKLTPQKITLAQVRGGAIRQAGGFATLPQYLGVSVDGAGQVGRDATNSAWWGSFPSDFVAFQKLTGQTGYWLTTGGQRDAAKPATEIVVNYDASAPAITPGVNGGTDGTADAPRNSTALRPGGAGAAAASGAGGLSAIGAPAGSITSPATVMRDDGSGLVPSASSGLSPLVLPLGGAALATLVSVLAGLHLAGRLRLPWLP
ncbi:hypothetical protein GCM10027515_05090 [Schumannella luteola]|uniref:Htaa domain-containing protein n=1 Tax=Schumannella luteola TaxID=472059 RepID=A0A852YAP5_9MICO|nr:hypothetical protein [Schumannella luteola]NYG98354.1 hypothetical protein [Schumannella luteola]TPX05775.1 hypothetical protein FJ656_04950 [Schumannella luteola]